MADFIAVIRRAVSGLSNNTPEMRVKVYEKARSAVMRQLENMSPRPSDDMLRRQIDKLEAAIVEVEAEYSAALAPEEQAPIEDAAPPVAPVLAEPEPESEPEAPSEPETAYEPEPEAEPAVEPDVQPEPGEETPTYEAYAQTPDYGSEPVADDNVSDEAPYEAPAVAAYEPTEEAGYEAEGDDVPAQEPTWADEPVYTPVEPESEVAGDVEVDADTASEAPYQGYDETTSDLAAEPQDEPWVAPVEPQFGSESAVEPEADEPLYPQDEPEELYDAPAAANAGAQDRVVEEVSWAPYVADDETTEPAASQGSSLDDALASGEHSTSVDEEGARDEFDALVRGDQPKGEDAGSLDLLKWEPNAEPSTAPGGAVDDSFDAWLAGGNAGTSDTHREEAEEEAPQQRPDNNDLSSLFAGVEPLVVPTAAGADDLHRADFSEEFPPETQTRAYRVEPARKRSFAPLVISVVALLVVAGGGYALWANKDAVGDMVDDMMAAAPEIAPASTEEPPEPTETAPAPDTETADASSAEPVTEAPAQDDSSTDGQKFTQRLLSDGTEVDPGEAPLSESASGRSVSEQNVAAGDGGAPAQADAAAPEGTDVATAGDGAVVAGGEKALLYEERLGQATPTAISGGIVWTRVEEQSNGRPEPAIQGRLSIPSNGLSALITIKRNTDNSLPASHLMEIVFSVPAEFEGGAVDEVQRVTMKRTEQERGEQLVAVSAKVTEDTYLVALNDFEDVVQRNLDLLATREWIDIPVTYRNGRRALLTLDKGASGQQIFDTVVKEWNALASSGG